MTIKLTAIHTTNFNWLVKENIADYPGARCLIFRWIKWREMNCVLCIFMPLFFNSHFWLRRQSYHWPGIFGFLTTLKPKLTSVKAVAHDECRLNSLRAYDSDMSWMSAVSYMSTYSSFSQRGESWCSIFNT